MRFDILDEYSTLVPFGLGVSKRNMVTQYPTAPAEAVKRGTIADCASRLKLLLKFATTLRHIGRHEEFRPIHCSHAAQLSPCTRLPTAPT